VIAVTTVFVTGATGNVGASVVKELRGRDLPVRAFVRDPGKAAAVLGSELEVAVGDFAEPDSILAALQGVEVAFLACGNHPRQVEYETNVIDAAARAGVRRLVKLSALGAEPGSRVPFWDWHGRLERHLRASGLASVVLRPQFYMSNLLGSVATIKAAGAIFAPANGAKIPMVDPRDVAAAAAVALTEDGHEGLTYVLTGPEAITFHDVAACLSEVAGRTIRYVDVPDAVARDGLLQAGMPDWMADNIVSVFGMRREDPAPQPTDAVRHLTGRQARGFADFARDHAALFAS
jgi:uncharacterized protein YbjT (DUF2867 family)